MQFRPEDISLLIGLVSSILTVACISWALRQTSDTAVKYSGHTKKIERQKRRTLASRAGWRQTALGLAKSPRNIAL